MPIVHSCLAAPELIRTNFSELSIGPLPNELTGRSANNFFFGRGNSGYRGVVTQIRGGEVGKAQVVLAESTFGAIRGAILGHDDAS